jgi:hypothetical protein
MLQRHVFVCVEQNVTLQEILNEDDVLQECKAQNKKLVDLWVLIITDIVYVST